VRLYQSQGREGYLLDVGANVGLIAIPAAIVIRGSADTRRKAGPVVVAVEAVPDNAEALKVNVALNELECVVSVLGVALGDVAKVVEIQVEGDLHRGEGTGTANIIAEGNPFHCVRIPLNLTTLDALMESGSLSGACSVVKLDTDGYDLKVLQGAPRFLAENRPVVFGEFEAHCLQWHRQTLNDVVEFASSQSYLVWQRAGKGWCFADRLDARTFQRDLLLVPTEQAGSLAWCRVDPS
jgi:FkbM family methyltransferase